jgi:alginate O-acetyltransferase complex protein AlgI
MITGNLSVLALFKYRLFLLGIVGVQTRGSLIIPLGISFYIFQLISYQVEIWRGVLTRVPGFLSFFLYIFFFPHHQAGPIMSPSQFIPAFDRLKTLRKSHLIQGLSLIGWGLFKKLWIADQVAPMVDTGFSLLHRSGGASGCLPYLAVLYAVQIYMDFSGYSDMALGLARLFGFKLQRNFHQPYLARNPREFWERWHISLSRWLRQHVYIPLGGNLAGPRRTLLNLMAVMLLGGLWHGASWSFVAWGGLHGLLLVGHRLLTPRLAFIPGWLARLAFQAVAMLTWLPFREPDFRTLLHALPRADAWAGSGLAWALGAFGGLIAFSFLEEGLEARFPRILRYLQPKPLSGLALAFSLVFYAILLGEGYAAPFIYQRF